MSLLTERAAGFRRYAAPSLFAFALLISGVERAPAAETATGESAPAAQPAGEEEVKFAISRFSVRGNTVLGEDEIAQVLAPFVGTGKTAADVEKGRDALEQYYHKEGFPTVVVNIPEQKVESGYISLEAIENLIGDVTVTGGRWYSPGLILRELPSLRKGEIVYVPEVEKDLGKLAEIPDLKVVPSMVPGKAPGTVDFELKVEDSIPLHGSIELNNRNSLNTTPLRVNATLSYTNLWQRLHALTLQYQTAPEKPSEVQVVSGSYLMPAPWEKEHKVVLYGLYSDSESGFGEGFKTKGKGEVGGLRYLIPLPPLDSYSHNLALGVDYKRFRDVSDKELVVSYLPVSVAYNASVPDSTGSTIFNSSLGVSFRGAVTSSEEFDKKRAKARGNYVILTAGLERTQHLPAKMMLDLKVDGQLTDQPLISNEQYVAGGLDTVRGYREGEASGDNGIHGTAELMAPELGAVTGYGERFTAIPYLFFDYASLSLKEPLPEQAANFTLMGTGVGIRGTVLKALDYQLDWAYALRDMKGSPDNTREGTSRVLFKVKYQF
ncbi:ShlB/FhaC/HecB family hemolysin secretion/activation protein [Geobacter pickeringii]|uniref:ShlB/FhaC/HecB family hemolysin secretion/activation protein n=1 Tax=Geobacter pickeringii TaxID=345632 RepID=UPI0006894A08|nr:ShlB/FhaC/HecB family hemolysin secretion/activation protein [Geobacter pickeringii]